MPPVFLQHMSVTAYGLSKAKETLKNSIDLRDCGISFVPTKLQCSRTNYLIHICIYIYRTSHAIYILSHIKPLSLRYSHTEYASPSSALRIGNWKWAERPQSRAVFRFNGIWRKIHGLGVIERPHGGDGTLSRSTI